MKQTRIYISGRRFDAASIHHVTQAWTHEMIIDGPSPLEASHQVRGLRVELPDGSVLRGKCTIERIDVIETVAEKVKRCVCLRVWLR